MNTHDRSPHAIQDESTQKHINFTETAESGTTGSSSSGEDEQSSAKQQWKEMREEKMNNGIDSSLQSPQDANTQKHINFVETEESETNDRTSSDEDEQSPAQQQWKEMREEKMNNGIDPSLLSPQDANTQKHINFLETEESETNNCTSSDD